MPSGMYLRKSLEERFWEKVDKRSPNECWPWLGACFQDGGYGIFNVNKKPRHASRIALELTIGPIGTSFALHLCNNPPCCNPAHLYKGTAHDNSQDAINSGRVAYGERHGRHKLTDAQVQEIRSLLEKGTVQSEIADTYGVTQTTVSDIKTRRRWARLS